MTEQFADWPCQAFDVLTRLEGPPSAETSKALGKGGEHLARRPMIVMLNDLADSDPRYADFSVWSYGKNPFWWQNQGAIARIARCVKSLSVKPMNTVPSAINASEVGDFPGYGEPVFARGGRRDGEGLISGYPRRTRQRLV